MTTLRIKRLDPDLPLPSYAHPDDAGMDLCAVGNASIKPGARALVKTGIAVALPAEHVGLIHPRSGLAAKHGITVLNAPGTIDAGYRGEIGVILLNTSTDDTFVVERGMRIAQFVVQKVEHPAIAIVDDLDDTGRGERGFGSTGGMPVAPPRSSLPLTGSGAALAPVAQWTEQRLSNPQVPGSSPGGGAQEGCPSGLKRPF